MAQEKIEIIISDQPASAITGHEFISRTKRKQFERDIHKLLDGDSADFLGRAWSAKNGSAYQIFNLQDKRVLVEDPDATIILRSMFDTDGRLRTIDVKE